MRYGNENLYPWRNRGQAHWEDRYTWTWWLRKKVKAEIEAYHAKEALKQAKLAKELTQEEADEKMGIWT